MNNHPIGEQVTLWLEPTRKKLKRSVDRSAELRQLLLVLANAAGCVLMLSPVLGLLMASGTALYLMNHIQGPFDLFLVEVLGAVSLFSGFLTVQLYLTRPEPPGGVGIESEQAPELYSMLERRVAHFRSNAIERPILTPNAELKIQTTPRWPVPLLHTYTLCTGAPLLFFITPSQFRLALAGTIAASVGSQRSILGWAVQASEDWPVIVRSLEDRPSLLSKLLLTPARWFAEITESLSQEQRALGRQRQSRWILENTDEQKAMDYLANQVVANAFLTKQYWPMIYKAAERSPTPVVKPFSHFELLLDKLLNNLNAKRWLLQAQASDNSEQRDLRDLLASLSLDHLHWTQVPEKNAFRGLFGSSNILKNLDTHWQKIIEPEWNQRHAAFQKEKMRFENLHKRAQNQHLRGSSASRYIQLAARFLDREQAVAVFRHTYHGNHDDASICFISGREMLASGCAKEGYEALQRAAELDNSLLNRAHALISEHKQAWLSQKHGNDGSTESALSA